MGFLFFFCASFSETFLSDARTYARPAPTRRKGGKMGSQRSEAVGREHTEKDARLAGLLLFRAIPPTVREYVPNVFIGERGGGLEGMLLSLSFRC